MQGTSPGLDSRLRDEIEAHARDGHMAGHASVLSPLQRDIYADYGLRAESRQTQDPPKQDPM
ncbi:hypothetical protein [Lysobacter gummosus]|uniref:hypothetical protein n=1 Tax=Lysobacter gummosus TaxID=262324 RepID=UPI00363FE5EC